MKRIDEIRIRNRRQVAASRQLIGELQQRPENALLFAFQRLDPSDALGVIDDPSGNGYLDRKSVV